MPDTKPAESPGGADAPTASAAADAASADASGASSASSDVAPPPAKRVRRDYPWRDVYVRDLGVRPIQFDAASGDAVLVECSFCVHFGREAPPVLTNKPAVKQDGQPIKTRARTRNVAHWKYPFRTDNMRSHHLQQHPHKWKLYLELLEQAKQQHIAAKMQGAVSDDVSGRGGEAEQRLSAFFCDSGELSSSAASTPSASAGNLLAVQLPFKRTSRASSDAVAIQTESATLTAAPRSISLAVGTVKTPAIVDAVLTAMADVPEHLELSDSGPAPSFFTPEFDHVSSLSDPDAVPTKYAVVTPDPTALHRLTPLLRAGLSFSQIATILEATTPTQRLNRGDVAAYARVLVASSLQRISSLLSAAWAYSLYIHVVEPTRSVDPAALCVNVRVPINQSRSVEEFHVITLTLRPDAESLGEALAFFRKVLSSLDVKWTSKVLSVSLDGATHCLGDRVDFVDKQLIPLLEEPKLKVFNGRQLIERRVQAAWTSILSDGLPSSFAATLLELLAVLRSDGEWVRRHGHCPVVKLQSASSVFQALNWLLKHRDAMPQEYSSSVAPSWWWLVACVVVEVWTSCRAAVQGLAATATQEQTLTVMENLRAILKGKCCFTDLEDDEMEEIDHVTTTYDEAERLATLTAAENENKITIWSDKSMAICFRTLNVSARRLFDELSAKQSASALILAEREVSRFVLQTVGHVCSSISKDTAVNRELQHPPTMPLDFSGIEPAQVVDLIEIHSRRLEAAFPTSFLDLAAREIRELQAALATPDAPLVKQLQSGSAVASFADAWAFVPQFSAARILAAGFATTLPQPQQHPAAVRSFSQVENGELPRFVLADLIIEAHTHAQQAERLDNAVSMSQTTVSLLESQVI